MTDDVAAPFDVYRDVVRPEWIDHVFDLATNEFLRWVGCDDGHRRDRQVTTFCSR
ncbi:MAG TPA: hypothetical protein VGV13_02480 [Methylomirabilota bacterium]|nr:hypothetical protein [Methylomirabilota bacterium]